MKLADHWFERYISVCIWYAGSIDVNRNQGTLCINWGSLFYLEKIEMEPENVARDRSNEARTTSFAVWPLTSVSTRLYAQQYRLSDSVLRIQLQNRSVKITGVWRTSAAIRWTLPRTCSGRSAETSAFALRRFRPGALMLTSCRLYSNGRHTTKMSDHTQFLSSVLQMCCCGLGHSWTSCLLQTWTTLFYLSTGTLRRRPSWICMKIQNFLTVFLTKKFYFLLVCLFIYLL